MIMWSRDWRGRHVFSNDKVFHPPRNPLVLAFFDSIGGHGSGRIFDLPVTITLVPANSPTLSDGRLEMLDFRLSGCLIGPTASGRGFLFSRRVYSILGRFRGSSWLSIFKDNSVANVPPVEPTAIATICSQAQISTLG